MEKSWGGKMKVKFQDRPKNHSYEYITQKSKKKPLSEKTKELLESTEKININSLLSDFADVTKNIRIE